MKKLIMDLQAFAGGHSITVYKDAKVSSAVVKNQAETETLTTDVASGTVCKIVATYATDYKLDKVDVLAGGVTVNTTNMQFTMPDEDVVLYVRSKRQGHDICFAFDGGFSTQSNVVQGVKKNGPAIAFVEMKTGYVFDKVKTIQGDATCAYSNGQISVTGGNLDSTIMATSKPANAYIVTENVTLNINNRKLHLKKNTKLVHSGSGAVYDIELTDGRPATIDETVFKPAIDALIKSGVLIKV